MGYQRDRGGGDRHRSRDYRPDSEGRSRSRRSRSPSDSQRHRDRGGDRYGSQHSYDRDQDFRRDDRHRQRHSRSRSRQRRDDDEMQAEQSEQKMRLAIRNNTINYDLNLHGMFMQLPQSKRQQLVEQAQSTERIRECILVRQLYVSGLYDAGEANIRNFFSKYGEIEDVQVIKNFVFVKYFKVEDASNACADYHNINTTLHQTHNTNFKIFFADHLKRFNVVSNNPLYEVKEHLIPVVYASVRNDPQYTNEQYLQSIFARFGCVRNMEIKRNQLPTQRTYVLVQYETLPQALRAREKMKLQRQKLGDRKSQITILIDNDKITRLYPNINNQLRYQRKRQQNTAQQQPQQQQQQQLPPQIDSFYAPQSQPQKETDAIYDMLKEFTEKQQAQEERLESDWCGFLTRNKRHKVEVDFYRIHKQPFQLETVLNVGYRGDLQEGLSRGDYALAGKFRAVNQANAEAFNEYINYLTRKERSGIIFTNKFLIYLVPPMDHLNIPYPLESNQLLALFFKIP